VIRLFNHTRHQDGPIRDVLTYAARAIGVKGDRLPPNTWGLEEEFWGRVDAIIGEALAEQVTGRDEEGAQDG
jgi:hypothetical protein